MEIWLGAIIAVLIFGILGICQAISGAANDTIRVMKEGHEKLDELRFQIEQCDLRLGLIETNTQIASDDIVARSHVDA